MTFFFSRILSDLIHIILLLLLLLFSLLFSSHISFNDFFLQVIQPRMVLSPTFIEM